MKPKHILILLLLCGLPLSVFAQIATPSIDPASPALLASAASWRFGTSVAVGSEYGFQETDLQKSASRGLGSTGLIAFQPTHVTTEIYALSGDQRSVWDASSDQLYPRSRKQTQVNLSVRGEGRVSVGLTGFNQEIDSRGVVRSQKGFGGSFGFRLGDGVFFGVGMNRHSETVLNSSDKQWNDYLAAVALAYGDPDSSMFRVEVGGQTSPLVLKGTGYEDVHYKTQKQFGDLEILWSRWFLSARSSSVKRFAALVGETDQTVQRIRYGLGYRSLSYSFIMYRTLADTKVATKEYRERYFQATLGIGFF